MKNEKNPRSKRNMDASADISPDMRDMKDNCKMNNNCKDNMKKR